MCRFVAEDGSSMLVRRAAPMAPGLLEVEAVVERRMDVMNLVPRMDTC